MTDWAAIVAGAVKAVLPARKPQVKREMVHEADADAFMFIPDKALWFASVADIARQREKDDPSELAIKGLANGLWYIWITGQRLTHKQLAAIIGCKRETVRRCLEYLSRHGAVAIINVMKRAANGAWHRAANLYLPPRMLIKTDTGPVRVSRRYFAKVSEFFKELAPKLGVLWNTFGYDRTPLRMPPLLPGEV